MPFKNKGILKDKYGDGVLSDLIFKTKWTICNRSTLTRSKAVCETILESRNKVEHCILKFKTT